MTSSHPDVECIPAPRSRKRRHVIDLGGQRRLEVIAGITPDGDVVANMARLHRWCAQIPAAHTFLVDASRNGVPFRSIGLFTDSGIPERLIFEVYAETDRPLGRTFPTPDDFDPK